MQSIVMDDQKIAVIIGDVFVVHANVYFNLGGEAPYLSRLSVRKKAVAVTGFKDGVMGRVSRGKAAAAFVFILRGAAPKVVVRQFRSQFYIPEPPARKGMSP